MLYVRRTLDIYWSWDSDTFNEKIFENLNSLIDSTNEFKFVVVHLTGKFQQERLNGLSKKVVGVEGTEPLVHGTIQIKGKEYGDEPSQFITLTKKQLYKRWTEKEAIRDEPITEPWYLCSSFNDSCLLKDTVLYFGSCEKATPAGDLLIKKIPLLNMPVKVNCKNCNKAFTKMGIDTVKVTKNVVMEDKRNLFYIKWRLLNACNYHCSYCIRKDLDKKSIPFSELKEKAIFLNKVPVPFRLELIGGEVSLLNLEELLEKVSNPNLKAIYISTNLSKPAEYFLSLFFFLKKKGIDLELSCSLHEEECDEDEFIQKVIELSDYVTRIYLECVVTGANDSTIKKIMKVEKENVKISLDYLRDRNDKVLTDKVFTPKYIKKDVLLETGDWCKIGRLVHHSYFKGGLSTFGKLCRSNGLYIDVDGKVYGRSCKQKDFLGTLDTYDFLIKENVRFCPNSMCNLSCNVTIGE